MKTNISLDFAKVLPLLVGGAAVVGLLAPAVPASAELAQYRFVYSGAPDNRAIADGVLTLDTALLQNPGDNGPGAIENVQLTVSGAPSGNGIFGSNDFVHVDLLIVTNALDLDEQWVGQPQGSSDWGIPDSYSGDFNFFNRTTNAPQGEWYFTMSTAGGSGESVSLVSVVPVPQILFNQGDAVPGVANATFSSFGSPIINNSNEVAFLAAWVTAGGQTGSGIFTNGVLMLKTGDTLAAPSGTVSLKTLSNPVLDDAGNVAFIATLAGTLINANNNSGVVSSAPAGVLAVVAQTGASVPDTLTNATWQSFTSVALPGYGEGALIAAKVQMGAPKHGNPHGESRSTQVSVNGVWATDSAGDILSLLEEGNTVIDSKTVKSFTVLNTMPTSPGQTRAFNGNGQLVANVVFTTGKSAIVQIPLP